jgi:hypothetical protein
LNSNGLISLIDGKQGNGCEVVFESKESIVSGHVVYQKFQSFINLEGWAVNEKIIAGAYKVKGLWN